ncbi:MAG: Thymidylate synthase [uncultured bacterium]|nr:MAG: Thymidylate synthase [uncultured bacterium]
MYYVSADSFSKVYCTLLKTVFETKSNTIAPRGLITREITDVCCEITNPYSNLFTNQIRSVSLEYLCGELIWYCSGANDLDFISKYSKFWCHLANENQTANSAYGKILFKDKNMNGMTQWEWATKTLIQDVHTRQAILSFNVQDCQRENNADFVCSMYLQFFIRENKLMLMAYMRSQDMIYGMTYDIPFFLLLLQCMRLQLLRHYPELKLGSYSHHVGSLHIYENKFALVKNMLAHPFCENEMPRISNNIILHNDVLTMYRNKRYVGNDEFYNWLSRNAFK